MRKLKKCNYAKGKYNVMKQSMKQKEKAGMRRRNEKKAERESGSGGVGGWWRYDVACISRRHPYRNHRLQLAKTKGEDATHANIAYARRGRDDKTPAKF